MSDMKKLLTIVTESGEKARIDEGVNVSINVSGDSPMDVGEVLAKVTNLSNPRPVTPDMMPAPSAPPPMPMVKAIDIVGKADEPKNPPMHPTMPPMAPETMGQDPMMPDPSDEDIGSGGVMNPPAGQSGGAAMSGSEEELESLLSQSEEELGIGKNDPEMDEGPNLDQHGGYTDPDAPPMDWDDDEGDDDRLSHHDGNEDFDAEEDMLEPKAKALHTNSTYKEIHDRLREIDRALAKKNEVFANEPDASYKDSKYTLDTLAGGINKSKDMTVPMVPLGNNPHAAKMETVVRDEWEKFKLGE